MLVRLLDPLAAEYRFAGTARERTGSRASYTAPSNVYRTADDAWITLVGSSDPIFLRLARAMEQPALAQDPRFATNVERTRHHVVLDDLVAAWCASLPLALLAERLEAQEVPFTKVYSTADVLEDPHFRARGTFIALQDDELGAIPAPASVPRFTGRTAPVPSTGPKTGQDNASVYGALGVAQQELDRLRKAGVV